jgi:hypothetical protein
MSITLAYVFSGYLKAAWLALQADEIKNFNPNLEKTMQFQSRTILATVALSIGLLSATTGANAALVTALGGQVVNDTDLNITWLANANLAATNTFGVSGISSFGTMDWYTAQTWIGAMNTANYLGYNDWRLPTTLNPDASCGYQTSGVSWGYNCTGSEMGHLFYNELGGVASSSITTTHNANYNLFSNLQAGLYWSGTVAIPDDQRGHGAFLFSTYFGYQDSASKYGYSLYALAVRPGQVSAVPEAQTYALMLAGLGLIGWRARRRG